MSEQPVAIDIQETPTWHKGAAAGISVFLLSITGGIAGVILIVLSAVMLNESKIDGLLGGILIALGVVLIVLMPILLGMVTSIAPGETNVRQFFGRYVGTVRSSGISLVKPFTTGRKVSVKVHNFETNVLKVNDLDGNPVNIAAIVVWQVSDTAKALFSVEDYEEFIATQAESALRHVATSHPYDGPDAGERSLRGNTDVVSTELAEEVANRVEIAGLEVIEVRISSLAYAPEIAQAMLQRQQASAIIAAREIIVEGAVTMVEQAISRIEAEGIVKLDEERKAQMVSNLLVVLTGDQRATPVINTGSLYN